MRTVHTEDFEKHLRSLSRDVSRLFSAQEKRLAENPRDPRLHIKKVRSLEHAFSLRVTRRYRAFFYFQSQEMVVFFDIDHRKDIYR